MCSSCGYKSIPYGLGVIALVEMVLGIIRIMLFFSGKPPKPPTSFFEMATYNITEEIPSPFLSSTQAKAAFALDWIGSIIPTFMGIYVTLFILLAMCSLLFACSCIVNSKNFKSDAKECSDCCKLMCIMCRSKSNHRCVSLTWNCPCYRARPRLRFQVRFGLLLFFIVLRIIAVILYATDASTGIYGSYMAVICTITIGLVVLMILIDFYQYRVWWYYRPDGAYKKCRFLCCKQHFHPSHQRFLPAPLLGINRDEDTAGDRPCQYIVSGNCPNLSLEHIAIFHAFDFKPLQRYQCDGDKIYIGFHQTKPEYAIGIAKTGFRRSMTPPQMLGFGVYFARSFEDTGGKARETGAFFVAKINMGKVRVIQKSEINEVRDTDSWWKTYDTIYYAHEEENRDEFVIKDPEQILKWIIIMDDTRLQRYGLDHEFDNTRCRCI